MHKNNLLISSLIAIIAVPLLYALANTVHVEQELAQINNSIISVKSQVYTDVGRINGPRGTLTCPSPEITHNLNTAARDDRRGGQVNSLQRFLAQYFGISETILVRTHFTTTTRNYLRKFQREQGLRLSNRTDAATRQKILEICQPIIITSITPTSGPYGTIVTLRGIGFARPVTNTGEGVNPANGLNVINMGNLQFVATGQDEGTKLVFIIPSQKTICPVNAIAPNILIASAVQEALNIAATKRCVRLVFQGDLPFGSYPVNVSIGGRTSNTVNFTVTSNTVETTTPTPSGNPTTSTGPVVHVDDCIQATTLEQCVANTERLCEFYNNRCQFPSCGALLGLTGKSDASLYEAGCFGEGVPDKTWTFTGKTNDCGGLKPFPPTPYPFPTNTPEPKQPGCFYKVRPTPTPIR